MKKLQQYLVMLYSVLAYLFFGGMLFTIITQYPNWDYNLPHSLEVTRSFYTKADPGTFFQLFGKINIPVFLIMIVLIWKMTKSRNLFLIHFILFFIIGIGTGILVYPILYELGAENISERSIDEINKLLVRFKTLDSIRSVIALTSMAFLTLALKEYYKELFM